MARPEMYAQGPGSLEDQVLLLMILMAEAVGMSSEIVGRDYGNFRRKTMKLCSSNMTLATEFHFESSTPINTLLKAFYEEFCFEHGFRPGAKTLPLPVVGEYPRPQT